MTPDIHIFEVSKEAFKLAKRYFMIQWEYWEEKDCETADSRFSLVTLKRMPIITVN